MFVIESDDMHHLVDDGRVLETAVVEGEHLHPRSTAHLREAAIDLAHEEVVRLSRRTWHKAKARGIVVLESG